MLITHLAFQVMVALGMFMAAVTLLFFWVRWKRPGCLNHPRFLKLLVVAAPSGFLAVEAGWTVTEVGRQPWIIYQVMRTAEALTPMPGLIYMFLSTTLLYLLLSILVTWLMVRQVRVLNARYQGGRALQNPEEVHHV